ncbi:RNA polymerase sigma factor [Sphingomonas abietis]|uniref:RNA polymerase sigma factor n=1 Tax=Sphingomonas abietis TaxID=3012344 RepID=A0ABY7NUR6_9SPHN|nr:RNA polymerase sigma factor [Sphingomonas abietis]WBO24307.1 RNA polymerase sigma factor [Sphingomonas abietis]
MAGWDGMIRQTAIAEDDDVATIDGLYASHAGWLRGVLRHRLRLQNAEAEDIVQDTYLRLMDVPARAIQHPKALLSRIALNLFRDQRRRDAVRAKHRAGASHDAPIDPSRSLSEQETRVELERLVLGIPELYREAFVLSRFGRKSHKDIAALLGISVKTVEWRISKAVEHCTARLQG